VDCGEVICSQYLDSIHNHCYVCDLLEGCGDHVKIEGENLNHCEGLKKDHSDQSSTEDL
jgi:hypothetical protein